MNYRLSKIAEILNITNKYILNDDIIHTIYIDSRQITLGQNALFVAISTNKNDGHKYIKDAYQKGVRNFLVQQFSKDSDTFFEDANYLITNDSIAALQTLAAYHRQQYKIPIIGITGSNGKTIVKEWLYYLLSEEYNICRSPRSFNSQVGVPLSVLNLNESHTLGIFEAGISLPREMNVLEGIIRPDIAVLTHFGAAHSEGFESDVHKLKEKLKLFQRAKKGIVQRWQNNFLQQQKLDNNIYCISESADDFFCLEKAEKQSNGTSILLSVEKNIFSFTIPFTDDASIKNAVTCFAVIYLLNKDLVEKILHKFSELPVVSLRMELKKARFQSLLINDYYNSDIDSFEISITYLQQYKHYKNKVLILSDYDEIKNTEDIYNKTKAIINQQNLSKVILIGKEWEKHLNNIIPPFAHYATTTDFIDHWTTYTNDFFNAVILLKGARKFEFEKIAHRLELKTHDTIMEINIPALFNNLRYYKNLVGRDVKMMCMIKASGYGSGSVEMAYALQKFGVDYIAVAYADEGVELKEANVQLPIMVMLPEKNSFEDIINYQLEPEIYSFEILREFVQVLEKLGIQQYPVHLKIDTGMHRLGFLPEDIDEILRVIQASSNIYIKSIFSHLAASESDAHKDYTLKQIQTFKEIAQRIENQLGYTTIKHICNSAAIRRFPEAHFDMVRLGIGMYGITDDLQEEKFLQNVLKLKTKIAQIKYLKKGESVGYSRNAVLSRDSKIGVIPIGYADGFFRKLGNGNFYVKFNQQYIKTIGNVCMDMTMLDLTDISEIKTGDEVIIFDSVSDIKNLSKILGTIPYEVLTSVSQRVNRVYIYE